jgi:hypothetical protein
MSDKPPRVYDLLVENDRDILGIFTYAVYKRQKQAVIQEHRDKNEGKYPTPRELASFYELSQTPQQLQHYKAEAISMLSDFCEITLGERARELEQNYHERLDSRVAVLNKPSPFWLNVGASLLASFIFVLGLGLLVFFLQAAKVGPTRVIEEWFDIRISPSKSDPTALRI